MAGTRTFGVTATGDVGILLNGATEGQTAEIAEARDEQGKVVAMQAYSRQKTFSYSGVLDTAKGTFPEAGTSIVTPAGTMVVESANKNWTNTEFATGDISCKSADAAEIIGYGGATE